jgi:outer membrane cobalamin receptor
MHKGLAELRWDKENSLCWGVQGIFMGSKKTGDPDIDRLAGYSLCNISLAYPSVKTMDRQNKPYQVELKVTNLFDTEYQNRLYFPAPGRWVTGSIKYRF